MTHFWNVQRLQEEGVKKLDHQKMIYCPGSFSKIIRSRRLSFLFHIPILGGWRNYVVLKPEDEETWHVGWRTDDGRNEISVLPLVGPVRMLIGTSDVWFFGINKEGFQIPIGKIGKGKIGDHGPYSKIQLC